MSIKFIVFIWSQLDGGKVEQKNNGITSLQTYDAKAKRLWEETSSNPPEKWIQLLCI